MPVSASTEQPTEILPPVRTVIGRHGNVLTPWQKGQSGNPSGSNLENYRKVKALAGSVCLEATEKLIELMRKGDDERVTYMAVMAILERAVGKPKENDPDDEIAARINVAVLAPAERKALATLLQKVIAVPAPETSPDAAP